jgi:hypothetical protein
VKQFLNEKKNFFAHEMANLTFFSCCSFHLDCLATCLAAFPSKRFSGLSKIVLIRSDLSEAAILNERNDKNEKRERGNEGMDVSVLS